MVEDALRGVVREALKASENGLPGNHHFFITFRTRHPGVEVSDNIRARYPDEMTIVLQHQYWGLEVTPDWFEVTLAFNRINERLHIPFAAMTAFADPAAKWGMQFQVDADIELPRPEYPQDEPKAPVVEKPSTETPAGGEDGGGQVIALDAFRKK